MLLVYHNPRRTPYISCVVCAAPKGVAKEVIHLGHNESTICMKPEKNTSVYEFKGVDLQTETISTMNREHS